MWVKNCIGLVFFAMLSTASAACEPKFSVIGDPDSYSYEQLPSFIRREMRPRVSASGQSDRFGVQLQSICGPDGSESSASAIFKIQPANVYLKDVNGLPMCVEKPDGYCTPGKYNFVDYKGGALIKIDKVSVTKAINVLSKVQGKSDLETTDAVKKAAIHNSVRLFAMLLAETTRFDYVLDDLTCAVSSGGGIEFMNYWDLVHNWASISKAVKAGGSEAERLKAAETYYGSGSLFVPITRTMVPYFNEFIPKVQGTEGWKPTPDGKNKPVALREPVCDLTKHSQILPLHAQPLMAGSAQVERDEIFSLLALAIVERDWQSDTKGRGHNIGSVLVTPEYEPVFYARNSIRALDNTTQHGEVRLIQNYLNCKGVARTAENMTVYTTLEPCAMCSGMMAMTEVARVVYVQKDPGNGGVREALKSINYPRVYAQDTTESLPQKARLERGYERFVASGKRGLTAYLLTEEAKAIFASAGLALMAYPVRFQENQKILEGARTYLAGTKVEVPADAIQDRCPVAR